MERETKFRVYIKEQDRIVYIASPRNDTFILFAEGCWFVYDTFTGAHELIASSENGDILMEYSGLLDSDNNEIYEGDSLETPEGTFKVVFDSGRFAINGEQLAVYCALYPIRVVGNVLENK